MEEINKSIIPEVVGHVPFTNIPIYDTILVMWGIMAFLIIAAFILSRNLKMVPKGKSNFAEVVVEFINGFAKTNVGHYWKPYAPYFGTIILFLIISNIVSIFNIFPFIKITPPTRSINVTGALAIMSMAIVIFSEFKVKGFKGWLKSFMHPNAIGIFIKLLDYCTRPLSLALRLFGNILGAFIVMELIYIAAPWVIPAAFSVYFDLFDGILQAYVFVFLTSLYIGEAVE